MNMTPQDKNKIYDVVLKTVQNTVAFMKNASDAYSNWDILFLAKQTLHSCSAVLCSKTCGGAWDCEHCPIFDILKELQEIVNQYLPNQETSNGP